MFDAISKRRQRSILVVILVDTFLGSIHKACGRGRQGRFALNDHITCSVNKMFLKVGRGQKCPHGLWMTPFL